MLDIPKIATKTYLDSRKACKERNPKNLYGDYSIPCLFLQI